MKTVNLSRDKTTIRIPIKIPEPVRVMVKNKDRGKDRIRERVEELGAAGDKEADRANALAGEFRPLYPHRRKRFTAGSRMAPTKSGASRRTKTTSS